MIPDQIYVLNALLRSNYLPDQRKNGEQIPPVFGSKKFTPKVARLILKGKTRKSGFGWDAIEYNTTRFNGVSRVLSIPHPLAYAHLCVCIFDNWAQLSYTATNKCSLIRPRRHADGRLLVMDYEQSKPKATRFAVKAFGRRFVVHTDITNFYPSIYSHAVPWAAVGFLEAKKHKNDKAKWYNQLDENLRKLKRNETQGVAIGPGTSNIVAEIILARIDAILSADFVFYRFIDDYTAFCVTESEGQDFVRRLSEELNRFKLSLSIKKTEIKPLPQPTSPSWLTQLGLASPKAKKVSPHDALTYMNLAIELSSHSPDGSVLKYAAKTLLGRGLEDDAEFSVLLQFLNLSFYHPVLLPVLGPVIKKADAQGFECSRALVAIAGENARLRRSDGVCWALYYMERLKLTIPDSLAAQVLATKDCLSLVLLYLAGTPDHRNDIVDFAKALDWSEMYELDQYWLLLYQLYFAGRIQNPYADEDAFPTLKVNGVSFLRRRMT